MTNRIIRDPMTLDEERRAMTTAPDASPHLHFIRGVTPAHIKRDLDQQREQGIFRNGTIAAVLSGDCDRER